MMMVMVTIMMMAMISMMMVMVKIMMTMLVMMTVIMPKKKILFVSCNGPKKDRVGRLVNYFFLIIFSVRNVCFMHVLR